MPKDLTKKQLVTLSFLGATLFVSLIAIQSSYKTRIRSHAQTLRQVAAREAILGTSSTAVTLYYDLLDGWNLVAFPVANESLNTASDIMREFAEQGAYVTTVSAWDGDKWIEFSMRGDQTYGFDFELTTHAAYFVRNHIPTIIAISGRVVPLELEDLDLKPGWNAVSLPEGLPNALAVLDELSVQDESIEAREINRFNSGAWQPFIKQEIAPGDVREYGDNFAIDRRLGYFVEFK
jgi:hypothetical protein